MKFKTPDFWYQPWNQQSALVRFLAPLGNLYGFATQLRMKFCKPVTIGIPVVCVGNLVAGGSGKTPTSLALLALLKESGLTKNPCFLTRGYGGLLTGPVFVSQHQFSDVGDESLLLARAAPTIVAKDRVAGAQLAVSSGHDMIIMDDGFQNPSLYKNVSFIVVDGRTGFGNGYMIPFGPLREPVSSGLARARGIIKIGGDTSLHANKPVIAARLDAASDLPPGTCVFGFCGLGQPEKFRQTLLDMGMEVVGFESFADHHPYSHAELQTLHAKAATHKAHLVTTEKDLCRLPSAENIHIVKIKLVFDDAGKLISLVREGL
jgi:tetraacyldisaccharide 4'-kinase